MLSLSGGGMTPAWTQSSLSASRDHKAPADAGASWMAARRAAIRSGSSGRCVTAGASSSAAAGDCRAGGTGGAPASSWPLSAPAVLFRRPRPFGGRGAPAALDGAPDCVSVPAATRRPRVCPRLLLPSLSPLAEGLSSPLPPRRRPSVTRSAGGRGAGTRSASPPETSGARTWARGSTQRASTRVSQAGGAAASVLGALCLGLVVLAAARWGAPRPTPASSSLRPPPPFEGEPRELRVAFFSQRRLFRPARPWRL
jgi:hypothetical protein